MYLNQKSCFHVGNFRCVVWVRVFPRQTPTLFSIESSNSLQYTIHLLSLLLSPELAYLLIFMWLLIIFIRVRWGKRCIGMIRDLTSQRHSSQPEGERVNEWVNEYPLGTSWCLCFLRNESYSSQLVLLLLQTKPCWFKLWLFVIQTKNDFNVNDQKNFPFFFLS